MTSHFHHPDWTPRIEPGKRVLVIGASGGLGQSLVNMLLTSSNCVIGAHGATKMNPATNDERVCSIIRSLETEADCISVVEEFISIAGAIDALVCLSGRIHYSGHWQDMPTADWQADIDVNLNHPFYLSRAAMARMKEQRTGGRIVLNGTEIPALHGGSAQSFPYAIAKRGTECLVEGLAREGAPYNILVNGVRLGCIASGFHQRWHNKTDDDMAKRIDLIPLKRAGHPDEAAALIIYLLSGWGGFITGQMIPLTGGDWL